MHAFKRLALGCAAVAALTGATAARADNLLNTVYVGAAYLQTHASLPDLSGYNTPPGLNLDIGNASTVGVGLVRTLNDAWSVELALGYPPRVRASAAGATWGKIHVTPGIGIVDADVYSPTAFVNYHPLGQSNRWDPFVGIGVNYTWFANTKALGALTGALGPTDISLSDSWGAAAHVGVVYHVTPRWSVVGTVAYADVKSTLTSTSYSPIMPGLITSQASTPIDFRPLLYTLAVGYSF